jgi:hypothetical protein
VRVAALVLALLLIVSPCFAGGLFEDNSNTNQQGQAQGQQQGQGQAQGQGQGQLQGQAQAAIAAQGQGQGQIALGKVSTDVNIGGDSIKSTALMFPNVSAAEGTNSATATYLFGSLGLSDTEMYKKGVATIQTVLAIPDEILTLDEKKVLVKQVVDKMMSSIRAKRLLGIGPEQHSKNLINIFGLLSWDSVWAENQKPFQCKSDIK